MRNVIAILGRSIFVAAIAVSFSVAATAQLSLRTAMDYEADGKADFTIWRPSNNVWYINKSNGSGNIVQQWGLYDRDYAAPGDFDGDGKGDISVWRDTDGVWYRLNSSNSTFFASAFGTAGDEPVGRDYDGDGKTDLAVVRRTGGNMIWYILQSSNQGYRAVQFGLSGDYVAPGDYDGDLKFDLAVQRPGPTAASQSTFYIQKSTDQSFIIANWGLSNDLVAPGDYDGDGKTDIAVVREGSTPTSPLVWYIQRSTNGSLLAATFGITGSDIITQNDYDGDGKTDISVWRDTNGIFYVLTSLSNFNNLTAFNWGLANDNPVASYDTH